MNLSDKDLRQLDARGITAEKLETQLNDFRCGFPFLKLAGSAVKGNGIQHLMRLMKMPPWHDGASTSPMADRCRNLCRHQARLRECSRICLPL
ncbi:MAG: DUF4301 family protein [Muribaculaceae bacterium]|nr:DUF4301 family protein [Muribaculaceae bacterium]